MERQSIANNFRLLSLDIRREIRSLSGEMRSALLVGAVLLVTISFQAVLSPPGGVWQGNGQCNTTEVGRGSSHHTGTNDQTPFNTTVGSSDDPVTIDLTRSNTILVCEHKAGTAIASEDPHFWLYLFCNSLTFGISNSLMVLVVLNKRIKILFFGLDLILCFSYFYSVLAITDDELLASCLASLSAVFTVLAVLLSDGYFNFFVINAYFLCFCYFSSLLTITQTPNWSIISVFLSALIFAISPANFPALERVRLSGLRIQSWKKN